MYVERTFILTVTVYPYWLHQILYPSIRQYVTSYVVVFHSGDIGPKKKKWNVCIANAFKSVFCGMKGSILRNKSIPTENDLGQPHGTQKYLNNFHQSISSTTIFCPMVYNFLIWNQPVTSFSHLCSVITEHFFKFSLPNFT